MTKVFLAADHAGFTLKNALVEHIRTLGYETEDMGAFTENSHDDYPDFIIPLAKRVAATPEARGIVIGGSGQGEAMAANRITGARAAVYYGGPTDVIELARTHNNANILSLGARLVSPEEAKSAVELFLTTAFSQDERHRRRLAKF